MYKVLHVLAGADIGGMASVVLSYYRFIDRSKIHFDAAFVGDCHGRFADDLHELGAEIFELPLKSENYTDYCSTLQNVLTAGKYDAIHVHENDTSYAALRIAKKCGIKQRIAHAHTAMRVTTLKNFIRRVSGWILNVHYATNLVACGSLAGRKTFGTVGVKSKKTIILPNAVDSQAFSYDVKIREELRRALGVSDKFVVGMVGRLAPEKNHKYALRIFKQFRTNRNDAVLLIVGSGEEEQLLRDCVRDNGMDDYVLFLGRRNDIAQINQALDLMIMPSLYEGFPVVAVEAMASGLPVLLADTITSELSFGSAVRYLKLEDDEAWISAMESMSACSGRRERQLEIKKHGLDINDTVKSLEQMYLAEANSARKDIYK